MIETIEAVRPVYREKRGDFVEICFKSGESRDVSRTINTVMKRMAESRLQNVDLIRTNVQTLLHMKKNIPLVYGKGEVFIPVKTRTPRLPADPCYSYIKLSEIEEYGAFVIRMKSGRRIEHEWKKYQVDRAVLRGRAADVLMEHRKEILKGLDTARL